MALTNFLATGGPQRWESPEGRSNSSGRQPTPHQGQLRGEGAWVKDPPHSFEANRFSMHQIASFPSRRPLVPGCCVLPNTGCNRQFWHATMVCRPLLSCLLTWGRVPTAVSLPLPTPLFFFPCHVLLHVRYESHPAALMPKSLVSPRWACFWVVLHGADFASKQARRHFAYQIDPTCKKLGCEATRRTCRPGR